MMATMSDPDVHDLTEATAMMPGGQPLAWELRRRRTELDRLERARTESEAGLAAYMEALAGFERRYPERLSPLYAELDALDVEIADKAARAKPGDAAKQRKAERVRAQRDAEYAPAPQAPVEPKARPDVDLKTSWRALSKLIHPDLAEDEADRRYREALMVQANAAYQAGDAGLIATLQEGWTLRHAPAPTGDEATLEHLMRQIELAEKRLAQAEDERRAIEETPLAKLLKRSEKAALDGVDLLGKLAAELDEHKRALQKRLKTLDRRVAKRER
jgi:hypothetical protein